MKSDSLKVILIIVLVAVAGFFLYKTMSNRQAGQAGLVGPIVQGPAGNPQVLCPAGGDGSKRCPYHGSFNGFAVGLQISKDNGPISFSQNPLIDQWGTTKTITTNWYNLFSDYATAVNTDQGDEIVSVKYTYTSIGGNFYCIGLGGSGYWTGGVSSASGSTQTFPVTGGGVGQYSLAQFGETKFGIVCSTSSTGTIWVENSASVSVIRKDPMNK